MEFDSLRDSLVHRLANRSYSLWSLRSDRSDRFRRLERADQISSCCPGRRMARLLLLALMIVGGLPVVSFAQTEPSQDVSQPMQELQDQWREIMKKEYNPAANGVMQPSSRPPVAKTAESAPLEAAAMGSGNLEGNDQSPPRERELRASPPSGKRSSSTSVRRSKSTRGRSSGRVNRSASKTGVKKQSSTKGPAKRAGRSAATAGAQTRSSSAKGTSTQEKATPASASSARTETPAQKSKPIPAKVTATVKQKSAAAKTAGSSQKEKATAKLDGSSKSTKKTTR